MIPEARRSQITTSLLIPARAVSDLRGHGRPAPHSAARPGRKAADSDYKPVSSSNPAARGETISLFATGLGPVSVANGLQYANTITKVLESPVQPAPYSEQEN